MVQPQTPFSSQVHISGRRTNGLEGTTPSTKRFKNWFARRYVTVTHCFFFCLWHPLPSSHVGDVGATAIILQGFQNGLRGSTSRVQFQKACTPISRLSHSPPVQSDPGGPPKSYTSHKKASGAHSHAGQVHSHTAFMLIASVTSCLRNATTSSILLRGKSE